MVYPCKGCTEKDNCEKNKCKKLKAYKKFRSENIKKNRVWAKELRARQQFDKPSVLNRLKRERAIYVQKLQRFFNVFAFFYWYYNHCF